MMSILLDGSTAAKQICPSSALTLTLTCPHLIQASIGSHRSTCSVQIFRCSRLKVFSYDGSDLARFASLARSSLLTVTSIFGLALSHVFGSSILSSGSATKTAG